jgi:hypothetical protein
VKALVVLIAGGTRVADRVLRHNLVEEVNGTTGLLVY